MHKDSLEYLLKALEDTNADELKQTFEVEKDGKQYVFEIKLTRKE